MCEGPKKILSFWASLHFGSCNSQANLFCIRNSNLPISYFKRGRKTSKTDVSFSFGEFWLSLSGDMKCTQLLLHRTQAFASFCRQKQERNPY